MYGMFNYQKYVIIDDDDDAVNIIFITITIVEKKIKTFKTKTGESI